VYGSFYFVGASLQRLGGFIDGLVVNKRQVAAEVTFSGEALAVTHAIGVWTEKFAIVGRYLGFNRRFVVLGFADFGIRP
jgi:hypothetical protein